ncbi:alpha/beta hydrolase-fold protein [Thermococcus waiotapuensis]|uniref:Alpha/beta hydrolase-fold protein n=1 Tax=Thermococcus waiotapuensis TaxID=90909 RepID=A0AAE4NUP1_9EURY|nr:alpha/beta hydrolase-fold protein [Thermococcus waiotapuensis]MDV3103661.1 alpha/beta hydrolase-fold protein [Thermococcus waiotapuensis]
MDVRLIGALMLIILALSGLYFGVNHGSGVQSGDTSGTTSSPDNAATKTTWTTTPQTTTTSGYVIPGTTTSTTSGTRTTLPLTTTTGRSTATTTTTTTASTTLNEITVTFVVSVPEYTPEGDYVYIAGDFNGWNPGDERYRLKRLPDGRWAIDLTFPYGTVIEFKFTRGSWETVEKGPNGEEISNRRFVFTKADTYEFTVYNWRDYVESSKEHTVTGNVRTFKMFIPQLNDTRRIWVYLPPDYNSSRKRYPVLYMFDGQNLFDNATAFLSEWGVDEALEKLYGEKNFSIIVVGIDNGGDRRIDEYAPWVNEKYGRGGLGNATLEFIVKNLKSFIDTQYRTDPEKTGIMGSSLGGLMALYAGFLYPDVFQYVGVMSPAFWFNPEIYDFVKNASGGPKKIYIDWGTAESQDIISGAEKMVEILENRGYTEGVNIRVVIDEGGDHNEYYWGKRFPGAVLWLFG